MKRCCTYKTLKLILQPFVENALYHGIEYMVDEGLIHISVGKDNEKILFEIRDNGVGMSEETLKNILSGQVKSEKGSGVGLRNVHERIQLYFGLEYGVKVESELEEGTSSQDLDSSCYWMMNREEKGHGYNNESKIPTLHAVLVAVIAMSSCTKQTETPHQSSRRNIWRLYSEVKTATTGRR